MVGTPATPASKMRRTPAKTPGGAARDEEKILVTVRVRPLNRREQALYDLIAWDWPDDQTIEFKTPNQERSPVYYKFDKVFDPACTTCRVYEEGAKDVALSALTGINATIFAYGQTSSGKTFTMRGITESAVNDIFEHICRTQERDFTLKFSALEIYNETVVDLLHRDSGPLRLLDDPEKGIIVEKLAEEVVKDSKHIKELIGICEAQRQVGETSLNDKSSRSHQIIRLTIESSLKETSSCVKSFIASLNLVDLAGSERASQTNADGTRLKEGSHINRSLLTLTTVIRKLSGARTAHVPYRDSKLTRILQHALGGNARTAIICTVSPALSHVEQTKNTLSFATSAKEVTNNAQINMVVSEKKLVKHLQKEVARLEAELRSPEPSSASCLKVLLREKNLKIEQMEREMKELKRQRDLAQSQLERERNANEDQKGLDRSGPSSHQAVRSLCFSGDVDQVVGRSNPEARRRNAPGRQSLMRQSVTFTDPSVIVQEIRNLEQRQRQLGDEANRALEVLQKEVASHKHGSQATADNLAKLLQEIKEQVIISVAPDEIPVGVNTNLREELTRLDLQESAIASLERKLEVVQKSIDMLGSSFASREDTPEAKSHSKKKRSFPFALSNSSNMQNIIRSPCSPLSSSHVVAENETENRDPAASVGPFESTTPKSSNCNASRDGTPTSRQNSVSVKKMEQMFKNAAEENIRSIRTYVTDLKERVTKLQYQKQLLVCQVLDLEASEAEGKEMDAMDAPDESPMLWHLLFEHQRREIIMLWHLCHVSIVHRTQFYLLFRGDPADKIYIEVELSRLSWLEQHLAELGNASPALLGDDPASSVSSSIKALKQEREYLAKRVSTKLTAEEREMLYVKWEIPPVGKQRRLQLVNKLWTDPLNMQHVRESAEVVAKLIGFGESGQGVSKEMFELSFANPGDKRRWMGWNFISDLLHL